MGSSQSKQVRLSANGGSFEANPAAHNTKKEPVENQFSASTGNAQSADILHDYSVTASVNSDDLMMGCVPADSFKEDDACGVLDFHVIRVHHFHEWSKDKRVVSDPPVMIRGLPWRILILHRLVPCQQDRIVPPEDLIEPPLSVDPNEHSLSFFLQCNAENTSSTWSCRARAEFYAVRQDTGTLTVCSTKAGNLHEIEHIFSARENDWGFHDFLTQAQMISSRRPLWRKEDDSVHLRVYVVAEPPHGTDWDSHSITGFVGLKNQGATCYLNSLLQALFFTNELRRAVYSIPLESNTLQNSSGGGGSVAFALQQVFHELQHSREAVDTHRLTRSFGWNTSDCFMQHDAQELCRVLLESLEKRMAQCGNAAISDTIRRLFCGKMLSYINCTHVNFSSQNTEDFYDVQLRVKGNRNVYEALQKYIQVETLDGENRYDAGPNGLQDAVKGVIFLSFPPVLYLHLLRVEYDHRTNTNVKVNDRFEFPVELDVRKFMKDPGHDTRYVLHSVLVHSGSHQAGHYVAYINPQCDGRWFKFNDDVVTAVSTSEAIIANYGGSAADHSTSMEKSSDEEDTKNGGKSLEEHEKLIWTRLTTGAGSQHQSPLSSTNAYMLVYVLKSRVATLLRPVTREDIPEPLRRALDSECYNAHQQRNMSDMEMEIERAPHLYVSIDLYTDKEVAVRACQGVGVLPSPGSSSACRLRVRKDISAQDLIREVSNKLSSSAANGTILRLWARQVIQNRRGPPWTSSGPFLRLLATTERPGFLGENVETVREIWCQMVSWPLYITSVQKQELMEDDSRTDRVLLFVKWLRLSEPSKSGAMVDMQEEGAGWVVPDGDLVFLGHVLASVNHPLGDLLKPFLDKCLLSASSSTLRIYFESDPSSEYDDVVKLPSTWYSPEGVGSQLPPWTRRRLSSTLQECRLVGSGPLPHGLVVLLAHPAAHSACTGRQVDHFVEQFYHNTLARRRFVLFQPWPLNTAAVLWTDGEASSPPPGSSEHSETQRQLALLEGATSLVHVWRRVSSSGPSPASAPLPVSTWCPLVVLPATTDYPSLVTTLHGLLTKVEGPDNDTLHRRRSRSPIVSPKWSRRSLTSSVSRENLQLFHLANNSTATRNTDSSSIKPIPVQSSYIYTLKELLHSTAPLNLDLAPLHEDAPPVVTTCLIESSAASTGPQNTTRTASLVASLAQVYFTRIVSVHRLFYRIDLSNSLAQLESQITTKILFLPYDQIYPSLEPMELTVSVPASCSVKIFLKSVCQHVNTHGLLGPNKERRLSPQCVRLWEVYRTYHLRRELSLDSEAQLPFRDYRLPWSLRVDEIHPDDRCDPVEENALSVRVSSGGHRSPSSKHLPHLQTTVQLRVCHFDGEVRNLFGNSFTVTVREGVLFSGIFETIRQRVGVSAQEFRQWAINMVTEGNRVTPLRPDPTTVVDVASLMGASQKDSPPWIGLNHRPPQPRSTAAKSLRIHGV